MPISHPEFGITAKMVSRCGLVALTIYSIATMLIIFSSHRKLQSEIEAYFCNITVRSFNLYLMYKTTKISTTCSRQA